MKKVIVLSLLTGSFVTFLSSCTKRQDGVCYCSYYAGNKTQYDLSSLPRSQQIDSCYVLNQNAGPFAGSCELE